MPRSLSVWAAQKRRDPANEILSGRCHTSATTLQTKEESVVLATVKIEDFDRFWGTFSTKGAEKRKQHGSKGSHVFRDPNDDDRLWVVSEWDNEGFQKFLSDPDMPAIFQEAGVQGRPQPAELVRQHDA
jgi:quinol monooxygenase YgiN